MLFDLWPWPLTWTLTLTGPRLNMKWYLFIEKIYHKNESPRQKCNIFEKSIWPWPFTYICVLCRYWPKSYAKQIWNWYDKPSRRHGLTKKVHAKYDAMYLKKKKLFDLWPWPLNWALTLTGLRLNMKGYRFIEKI